MQRKKILFCTSVFCENVNSSGRHMIDLVKEFDSSGSMCDVVTNVAPQTFEARNTKIRKINLRLRGLPKQLRLVSEILIPIALYIKNYFFFRNKTYDACIVYSPSIFWFLLVRILSKSINGKKILIFRDLFPIWLKDIGILKEKSLAFEILNYFCLKQLQTFDVVLVQDPGDIKLLKNNYSFDAKVDVLKNWYSESMPIDVEKNVMFFCQNTKWTLAVVGNFGPAQDLAHAAKVFALLLQNFDDLQIIFIGQSYSARSVISGELTKYEDRTLFIPPISHDEVINILKITDAGFFGLDFKNQQGHFPGKVLAYLMAGRPVYGFTGEFAPIKILIENNDLGLVTNSRNHNIILSDFNTFMTKKWSNDDIQSFALENFETNRAYKHLAELIEDAK